jgi:hypothetical protein
MHMANTSERQPTFGVFSYCSHNIHPFSVGTDCPITGIHCVSCIVAYNHSYFVSTKTKLKNVIKT